MLSLRWPIVWLIFSREVRDQLRDRRTLFMIFVLPILLYPALLMLTSQLLVAVSQRTREVVVVGAERLPTSPPLLTPDGDHFEPGLFATPGDESLYRIQTAEAGSDWSDPAHQSQALQTSRVDVILVLPAGLDEPLRDESLAIEPQVIFDSASDRSRDTARAVREVLARWNQVIVSQRLERDSKPATYIEPVQPRARDVARVQGAGGSIWYQIFPFLLVVMALTGAFYPAVDLCAGEKERGTMETLLITPASRAEIVAGKYLTVFLASVATALLNLASMVVAAWRLKAQVGGLGGDAGSVTAFTAPPLSSMLWMVLLLIPLAGFFSALCVALAAMARSMKEGQYYLTPLYLLVFPLVIAAMVPGVELDLLLSLVPITGVTLLLKKLLQGNFLEARAYFLPVLVPLLIYGALALRWAVAQFQRESVLFRESERFDLASWLRSLVRDRRETPSSGLALFAFAVMLASAWFASRFLEPSWRGMIAGQLAYVLAPTLLLAFLFTSSVRRTLLLNWPSWRHLALATGLALAVHPLVAELRYLVDQLFPLPDSVRPLLEQMFASLPSIGIAILALAIVPAVCEELAFRGLVLQGLRRDMRPGSAVLLAAFLFGFMHVLLSVYLQLFNATVLGVILGLIAIRSGSIVPGIVFHALNNTLAILLGTLAADTKYAGWSRVLLRDREQALFHWGWVLAGLFLSAILLALWWRDRSRPERSTRAADDSLASSLRSS